MKRALPILLAIIIVLGACTEANFVRYRLSEVTENMIPREKEGNREWVSSAGDTLSFYTLSSNRFFEPQNLPKQQGSLINADELEEERLTERFGNSASAIEFRFLASSHFAKSEPALKRDSLSIAVLNAQGKWIKRLALTYSEGWSCANNLCNFVDTLVIDSTAYTNVYFNNNDSNGQVFVNQKNGIIQYLSANGKTYTSL